MSAAYNILSDMVFRVNIKHDRKKILEMNVMLDFIGSSRGLLELSRATILQIMRNNG